MDIFEKHIDLVKMVNCADSEDQHDRAEARLRGFRDALEVQGINQLSECDMHYISQGIDRPMCCGVFLDWVPFFTNPVEEGLL